MENRKNDFSISDLEKIGIQRNKLKDIFNEKGCELKSIFQRRRIGFYAQKCS
jgi:arsenate reductase-like glutaredoxin family protein